MYQEKKEGGRGLNIPESVMDMVFLGGKKSFFLLGYQIFPIEEGHYYNGEEGRCQNSKN
jgi:hypothetical protein